MMFIHSLSPESTLECSKRYAFPPLLRDKKIEEIYHRGHILKEKESMRAFTLIEQAEAQV